MFIAAHRNDLVLALAPRDLSTRIRLVPCQVLFYLGLRAVKPKLPFTVFHLGRSSVLILLELEESPFVNGPLFQVLSEGLVDFLSLLDATCAFHQLADVFG